MAQAWFENNWFENNWFDSRWYGAASGGGPPPTTPQEWFENDWYDSTWFNNDWFGLQDTGPVLGFGTDIVIFRAIRAKVDVKISRDRGSGTSSASAAVTVTFNKTFADIRMLDAWPIDNTPGRRLSRVISFVDAPDPVSFNVEFYDEATGNRVAVPFGWEASGVLKGA